MQVLSFFNLKVDMEIPEYPPNSETSKRNGAGEKEIKRVTKEEPIRRKRPLRKKFAETFVAGDPRGAAQHMLLEVMIPATRDMIAESVEEWIRSVIFGQNRGRRGHAAPPQAGPTGYVQYHRMASSAQSAPQRAMSRQARARHDFDEIVLKDRAEAETVIEDLYEVVGRYGVASVADLYSMVGISSNHTDNSWGWDSLRGSGVSRVRGGFLLDLPEPKPLA